MHFQLLLYILSKLFIRANKKNNSFRKMVGEKNIVFQLLTKDKKTARHFEFRNGRISSRPVVNENASLSIIFNDSNYAVSVLLSKDKDAFTQGILSSKIVIEGDLSLAIWFQNLAQQLKSAEKPVPSHLRTIGFVGVGLIGAPMARSLVRNGFTVKAHDRNSEALDKISEYGAIACDSLELFHDVDVVIIMVNTMEQVEDVVMTLMNILPEHSKTPLVIMSTVSPDRIIALRKTLDDLGRTETGILDAPVSGAPLLAEAGKLSLMAGGEKALFNRIKPVLLSMGDKEKIFYMGDLGRGAAMKLVNNVIGISVGVNVIEALSLGQKKGLKPDEMARVINASSGKTFFTEQWPLTKKMFDMVLRDTTYSAKSALFTTGLKDLETAKAWGQADHIEIPCVENAIGQIKNMTEDQFVETLENMIQA